MDSLCNYPCRVSSDVINLQLHFEDGHWTSAPSQSALGSSPLEALLPPLRPTHQAVNSDNTILPFPPPGPSPVRTETSKPLVHL